MSPLRARMMEDMRIRVMGDKAQQAISGRSGISPNF
jgi:hypothetical protein